MSDTRKHLGIRSAAARRTRFGLTTTLLLVAATASCALATMIGAMTSARFDVTATREHALSPRTQQLLGQLDSEHEIVVVADFASLDSRAEQRIGDVLTEFERASEWVSYTRIDSISPEDRRRFTVLVDRLASLQQEELRRHIEAIEAAAEAAGSLAAETAVMSERLLAIRDALSPEQSQIRESLRNQAAVARTWGTRLARAGEEAEAALEDRIAGSTTPAIDQARRAALGPIGAASEEFDLLKDHLGQLGQALGPAVEIEERINEARRTAERIRDDAARTADRLERLKPLDVVSVARIIESGPAAVIMSPRGATAVRFDALFPSTARIDQGGGGSADLRFVGEELLATAIASLSEPNQPIVVFVHAQPGNLFTEAGEPTLEDVESLLGSLLSRLRLRGIDIAEWPVAVAERPPWLGQINPEGVRPIVWVTLGAAVSTAQGAERMGHLSAAIESLLDAGERMLISVEPSTLPRVGEPDPMVAPLERYGLSVDSGRALLRSQSTPTGRVVSPGHAILPRDGEHPAAEAIKGLSVFMPWPVPIALSETEGVATWPLLRIEDSENTWAESQWLDFRSIPPAQRSMISNPPTPDEGRDDVDGPWIVAAAAERRRPEEHRPQRLVVVASNGWFFDEFTQQRGAIEGRSVSVYPGNAELFEAAMYWLSDMDHMIAPSPRVRDISRISALAPGQLRALRWGLLAGAPLTVLLIGVALRLIRG